MRWCAEERIPFGAEARAFELDDVRAKARTVQRERLMVCNAWFPTHFTMKL